MCDFVLRGGGVGGIVKSLVSGRGILSTKLSMELLLSAVYDLEKNRYEKITDCKSMPESRNSITDLKLISRF